LFKTLHYETPIYYTDPALRNILYTGHRFYLIDFGESRLFYNSIERHRIPPERRVESSIKILLHDLKRLFSNNGLMSEHVSKDISSYNVSIYTNISSILDEIK